MGEMFVRSPTTHTIPTAFCSARVQDRSSSLAIAEHHGRALPIWAPVLNTFSITSFSILPTHTSCMSRPGALSTKTANCSVRTMAESPSSPKILVAGALDGVFRSDDGGDHWNRISPEGHKDIKNIESLAIDPKNPD